ncbi:MAG: UDP-3-O-(3-hydroxymyristoyl)glucosamine N-acyltransferase, partial [Candidatus Goldbacteria bacterium]|nr:UDP-3-O-(3-hydroxymyristoyl)glucosamine N-acyltransferase [Candidatus Goldiibacteriota bacterium]
MTVVLTAGELAEKINGKVIYGNPDIKISGISDLTNSKDGDVSFILSDRYLDSAVSSKARIIISDSIDKIGDKTIIKVRNARDAYIKAINVFYPAEPVRGYISKNASVSQSAGLGKDVCIEDFVVIKDGSQIGDGTFIGSGSFIGKNCVIGKNVKIFPDVSIYDGIIIGDNTIVHSGVVIGADGFGYFEDNGKIIKIRQIGNVKIGQIVEMGSNTT